MTGASPCGEEGIFSLAVFWKSSINQCWINKSHLSMCCHQTLGTTKHSSLSVNEERVLPFARRDDDARSAASSTRGGIPAGRTQFQAPLLPVTL